MHMKVKTLSLLAGAGALMLTSIASASFTGLSIEHHANWSNLGTDYDVYRVYANFDGSGIVGFWGGAPDYGPFSIATKGGSNFYQSGFAGSALPQQGFNADGSPNALYAAFADDFNHSSFLTIGVAAGYSQQTDIGEVFQLTPGFSPSLNGTSVGGIGGVVTNPGGPNSMSVNGQVLLAQLTVVAGEGINGENITLSGQANGESFEATGLSFSTVVVPAPGALALLGIAGLVGTRRRRA